jgi:DNA-binding transcriptional LysR family regulator
MEVAAVEVVMAGTFVASVHSCKEELAWNVCSGVMRELKHLRVLRAVAQAGSFSAAADALDYTQPAVSKMVAALEREVGATLVDRGTRPLRLTDAGAALSARAAAAFEQLATAQLEVEAICRVDGGTLSVATFSSAGSALVVDALRALRASHPAVDVRIAERSMPSAALQGLRDCDFDLVVTFDYPDVGAVVGEGLEVHPLLDDAMDLVVPRDHRLASRKRVGFADLADEDWLLPDFGPESPSFKLINRGCVEAGFEPRIVFRINDCHMTQAMVAAGEGISVLPRLMLHPVHPGVSVKPLGAGAPIRRIVAVRLPTRYLSPSVERFLDLLRDAAVRHAAPL